MMTLSVTNSINVLYVILIHAECRYAGCHIAECRRQFIHWSKILAKILETVAPGSQH